MLAFNFNKDCLLQHLNEALKPYKNPNIHLKLCNGLTEAIIEKNTHYFQFCGVITFYSKSSITYVLLFYCVSTNALIN
jgi:hypothetical protein